MSSQKRPRNLKIPKKKKTPFLLFVLFFLIVLVVIYFFWQKKRNVSSINTDVKIENTQQSSFLTVKQDSIDNNSTPDSLQPFTESQKVIDTVDSVEIKNISETDLHNFSDKYDTALRLFYTEQYSEAIKILSELKQKFPSHSFAVNCQYWIGECYFGLREYNVALESFQKVLLFGNSSKSDDTIMMIGRCFYKLNDKINAKFYFNKLLLEYPQSEYISKARLHMARL